MTKMLSSFIFVSVILLWGSAVAIQSTFWDDGQTHLIGSSYKPELEPHYIHLDSNTANDPGTRVILLDYGFIDALRAYNKAEIVVNGGWSGFLQSWDNSTINMNGGTVGYVDVMQDGIASISGGSIRRYLRVATNGIAYLDGTDFAVDGQFLSYGDRLSDFASFTGGDSDGWYAGIVTGTLADGSAFSCDFEIYNTGFNAGIADIIIIPEPATLALLSLGGLLIRRKK